MAPNPEQQPPARPEAKGKRKLLLILIAVIALIVMCTIAVYWYYSGISKVSFATNTEIITVHGATRNTIQQNVIPLSGSRRIQAGGQLTVTAQYGNQGSGRLVVTGFGTNTTGFRFVSCTPALPLALPNAPTLEEGNTTVTLIFDTPDSQYNGPFEFTVYMDYFPEG